MTIMNTARPLVGRTHSTPHFFPTLVLVLFLGLQGPPALAQHADHHAGVTTTKLENGVVIENPWTRATPPGVTVGGAYLSISNEGPAPVRLMGGDYAVRGRIEVHQMAMKEGVMTMRRLPEGLEILPGERVFLQPGGVHLMVMGLQTPLVHMQALTLNLKFEGEKSAPIVFPIAPLGAKSHDHAGHKDREMPAENAN